jgi:hypothetical protein
MKKIVLFAAVLMFAAFNSFAQSTTSSQYAGKFSIGLETGLPVNYTSTYWIAVGGSFKYEQPVTPNVLITLSAGYTDYNYTQALKNELRANYNYTSGLNFVPVKIGAKYFLSPSNSFDSSNTGFFGEMQVGAAIGVGKDHSGTAFIYAPGVGYQFETGFEAGLRFESWNKSGSLDQVALRLAYSF